MLDCLRSHTLHYYAANKTYNFLQGFLDVDCAMLQEESLKDELAGTTAVAIILKDNRLYCVCAAHDFVYNHMQASKKMPIVWLLRE